ISRDGEVWEVIPQSPTCGDVCWLDLDLSDLPAGPYSVRSTSREGASSPHSFVRSEAVRYSPTQAVTAVSNGLGVVLSWTPSAGDNPIAYQIERRVSGAG